MEAKNDPVLELADGWKEISYFERELTINGWIKWIATDEDGWVWGYKSRPVLLDKTWSSAHCAKRFGPSNLNGLDWRETLREV